MIVTHYSWGDIDVFCTTLVHRCQRPDIIVPVIRGGMALASILSHRMGCSFVVPYQHQTRDNDHSAFPSDLIGYEQKHILVVEDLIDSGETIRAIKNEFQRRGFQRVEYCAIIKRPDSDPDVITAKVDDFEWIHFPWEYQEITDDD